MLTSSSFTLDSTISFQTYAGPILGALISNVKVTDILSYETARLYRNDLLAVHQQVYGYIPVANGVPNDPTKYKYIKVINPDGSVSVYGIPWIVDGTVEIYAGQSMQITLDNLTPDQQNMVLRILAAAGFTATNVTYPSTATGAGTSTGSSGSASGASGSASGTSSGTV